MILLADFADHLTGVLVDPGNEASLVQRVPGTAVAEVQERCTAVDILEDIAAELAVALPAAGSVLAEILPTVAG